MLDTRTQRLAARLHLPARQRTRCHIDELSWYHGRGLVRGWVHRPGTPMVAMGYQLPDGGYRPVPDCCLPSPDVASLRGPTASHCRFEVLFDETDPDRVGALRLVVAFADGRTQTFGELAKRHVDDDAYHGIQDRFFDMLREERPGTVLEIGSRNRSGTVRRAMVPDGWKYVGLDVVPGENVDVVGDAHEMDGIFAPGSIDAAFSVSTFEHLMRPWIVADALARVLRPRALVLVCSHQTWPAHELPYDYWRFSPGAWDVLFAEKFEMIETAVGERASVVAHGLHPATLHLDAEPAYLGTAVLCRRR